jgi:hypothetical protein
MRRIYFARVNRRLDSSFQDVLDNRRPFREDMASLLEAAPLRFPIPGTGKEWIAADLEWRGRDDQFLVGMLGQADEHTRRLFDEVNLSWLKGETRQVGGAREEALVPFAVDTREHRRYVAFATGGGLNQVQFLSGFTRCVNHAVSRLGLWPVDWDIDLVTLRQDVYEWLRDHGQVFEIMRIVRLPNPGGDLSDIRRRMRALRSREARDIYKAQHAQSLDVVDDEGQPTEPMIELTEGLEEGDVQLRMRARRIETDQEPRFDSIERSHFVYTDDWADHATGINVVLERLIEFSESRANAPDPEHEQASEASGEDDVTPPCDS